MLYRKVNSETEEVVCLNESIRGGTEKFPELLKNCLKYRTSFKL
jgi:hypothetical protein